MHAGHITSLLAEATIVVVLLLLLFHRRRDWGLTPLFIAMGVLQHMQVVLAASVYVPIAPDIIVSPGSVVLFPSTLFAVLLVYIYEDAIETRKLIYALLMANISLALLSYSAGFHVTNPETINAYNLPREFFWSGLRIMTVGTLCLFLDSILIIVMYEALAFRRLGLFIRILLTMTAVLCLDQILFVTGAFVEDKTYQAKLVSGLVGKSGAAVFYSIILWAYLRLRGQQPPPRAAGYSWDIFRVLSYREKYDQLGEKFDALEERVLQRTAELNEANENLRSLSQQLLSTQETERRNLARALHDEIGQLLTVIRMQLKSAEPGATNEALRHLESAAGTIDETISQIRNLSLRLRPSMLDDLGLQPTLEWQVEQLMERTGTPVSLTCDLGEQELNQQQETVLFRVAQEAMTNVMRHADATQVTVALSHTTTHVVLSIRDNGIGFEPQRTMHGKQGLGLAGMHERVELIGGELIISSEPDNGTELTVSCPIDSNNGTKKL